MPSIHLYAELLSNIRAVTLVASLETVHNEETRIEISQDGETIAVTHEGQTANLSLPTQISGGGTVAATLPPTPTKDVTLRLQLEEKEPGLLKLYGGSENVVPWGAEEMKGKTIVCAKCDAEIVRTGEVRGWKDLPREDWAEMMDFWHCHKPHEHDANDHGHGKGYPAHERLRAQRDAGLVGLTYFLLSPANLKDTTVSHFSYSCKPSALSLLFLHFFIISPRRVQRRGLSCLPRLDLRYYPPKSRK
jgi:hypothetical protein